MNELINLDGLGEIIVNLTNKLASGIGWIANKETPKRLAINTYIKEIQESDYDPVTKAALISHAKQIIKEYCNQKDIVNIATSALKNDATPEKIENDWLEQFMDKAKLVSSQEFQWIWGNILARECNKPGSIPRVLLYTLEKMDREDAEAFTALCNISVQLEGEYSPVIIGSKFDEYDSLVNLTFDKLVNLKSLGLIEMDLDLFFHSYALEAKTLPAEVIYFDEKYILSENKEINVGKAIFTKSGQALCQSINANKIEGFWEEFCLPFWEKSQAKENNNITATSN